MGIGNEVCLGPQFTYASLLLSPLTIRFWNQGTRKRYLAVIVAFDNGICSSNATINTWCRYRPLALCQTSASGK